MMWPFNYGSADPSPEDGFTEAIPAAALVTVDSNRFPSPVNDNTTVTLPATIALQNPSSDLVEFETDQSPFAQPQRLSLVPATRVKVIGGFAFGTGFFLGAAHGSTTGALRYRAENAHHTPTSKAGWFLYGKSKNYHAIADGGREGVKNGARYFGWVTLFLALEEGLDRARGKILARRSEEERPGQRDFLSTVSAAVALSGIYSWKHRLDRFSGARMTMLAVKAAIPFGLLQDLLLSLKGNRPWYVDRLMKKIEAQKKVQVI